MAVNREPILKRCKSLGISPAVMGIAKETKRDPNANKRKKVSEYGMQLKEKQKLKFIYGVLEKQFRHLFELAEKMEGQAGANLITLLESRLDNVVYRMGLSMTRKRGLVSSLFTVIILLTARELTFLLTESRKAMLSHLRKTARRARSSSRSLRLTLQRQLLHGLM